MPPGSANIVARFLYCAETAPDRIAVIDSDGVKTYGELRSAAIDLAMHLTRELPDGALVAVLLPTNAGLVTAALASLVAGHPYLPLDARAPQARINQALCYARPAAVLVSRETEALVSNTDPELLRILIDDPASVSPVQILLPDEQTFAGQIASIHYTSGSTGRPKGVIRSRPQVAAMIARLVLELDLSEQDRVMIGQNSSTAAWHETMLSVLSCGAQFSIDPFRDGLRVTIDRLRRERITVLRCTATMLRMLTASIDIKINSLRLITVGSEWLFAADLASFRDCFGRQTRLLSIAGTTECGWISRWFIEPEANFPSSVLPAGFLASDVMVSLLDPDGNRVAPGEPGQLIVSGPTVSSGYWRDPEATAAAFASFDRNSASQGFRTGDIARLSDSGMLELLGRTDRMVKINGVLISLIEIEGVMRSCAGVADAAILARKMGDAVVLIGYLVPEATQDHRSLSGLVRERLALDLPATMRPAELHCLVEIPRLGSGKLDLLTLERVDRERLQPIASSNKPSRRGGAAPALQPVDPIHDRLIAEVIKVFEEVLGDVEATPEDNMSSLGGDSLQAVKVALELGNRFAVAIPPNVFESAQTIRELAAWLAVQKGHLCRAYTMV